MRDASLSVELPFPPAGQSVTSGPLDLGVGVPAFSEQWNLGRLYLDFPALPGHTDPAKVITLNLLDSTDGLTFAPVLPAITFELPGIAVTGSAASGWPVPALPLPPGLRGPIAFQLTVPAGAGDFTAAFFKVQFGSE